MSLLNKPLRNREGERWGGGRAGEWGRERERRKKGWMEGENL